MSDQEPPEVSILDARLAEIDRRLLTIQTGLLEGEGAVDRAADEPHHPPVPPARAPLALADPPPPEADPPPPADPSRLEAELPPRVEIPQPVTVAGASASRAETAELVAELRELAAAHAHALETLQRLLASYEHALGRTERRPPTRSATEFSVSAGPFSSTEALRGFERTLSQIPEVREVELRGYEGDDRAIVDVHLHDRTS